MTHPLFRLSAPFAAVFVGFGGLASAQLTSIGPFSGTDSEGFETQDTSANRFPTCVADRVFNDQAHLCSATGGAYITTGWAFSCTMPPQAELRYYGSTSGASVFTFDDRVIRFGGYFGSHNPSANDGVIEFYDEVGALVYSDVIVAPNDCSWTWNGWDLGLTPIREIVVRTNYSSGSFMLMDSMEADIIPTSSGTLFCFCDGSGTAAPCGNHGPAGRGCTNSSGSAGQLFNSGVPTVTGAGAFTLKGRGLTPGTPGLYFEGLSQVAGGAGSPLGDGLLCAGGQIQRMEIVISSNTGDSASTVDVPASTGVSGGETRYYQLWYRDPNRGPCGFGFNLTNGLAITWQP